MAHWKLTLMYDGSSFHGWQVQPGLPTIQGTVGQALARLTGENVLPQGSGRTDAGVHALGQVCSFSLESPLPAANLQRALNRILPSAIRVIATEERPADFHARHSALRKTYEYRVFERRRSTVEPGSQERVCTPFVAPFAWDVRWPLDLNAMRHAATLVCGTHDFTSFAAADPDRRTREDDVSASPAFREGGGSPVRSIFGSSWERRDDLLLYRVTGSGFLHHMVRNLVGTFVDVGRGSLAAAALPEVLAARDRSAAGPTAPAQGLFLVSVTYGDDGPNRQELGQNRSEDHKRGVSA